MIVSSSVSDEASAYIAGRLSDLAAAANVRILFAIESGSRAWGFPSADSDYDVRFVYVRPQSDYLSVREFRDVIETPTIDDPILGVPLDLNGWDIRKALRLGLSSNPVLHEWLSSPIIYSRDEKASQAIRDLATGAAEPGVFRYHYDRLCRSAWNQLQTSAGASIKRYCYALRPALMLKWLRSRNDLPPMDVHTLCSGLDIGQDTLRDISELFRRKTSGDERDAVISTALLNNLIAGQLATIAPRPEKTDISGSRLAPAADEIFLQTLKTPVARFRVCTQSAFRIA